MLGIIGGSGFYRMDGVSVSEQRHVKTPFGDPSGALTFADSGGGDDSKIVFLPRHGEGHTILPSEINYRANIWALKASGVKQVIAVSAVGSLRQELAPGHFVVPAQYADMTKGVRKPSFFGDGLVAHVSTAQPVCPTLSAALAAAAEELNLPAHRDKVYACVEGPRLGTRAESFFLRDNVGADVVGMTNVPEVFLAREAQLCYATLAVVTDYDCWLDDPAHHVTVEEVIRRFGESIAQAKSIIGKVLSAPPPVNDEHRTVLASSLLTPPDNRTEAHQEWLAVLST